MFISYIDEGKRYLNFSFGNHMFCFCSQSNNSLYPIYGFALCVVQLNKMSALKYC